MMTANSRTSFLVFASLLAANACGGDNASSDASSQSTADAASEATPDAAQEPDAGTEGGGCDGPCDPAGCQGALDLNAAGTPEDYGFSYVVDTTGAGDDSAGSCWPGVAGEDVDFALTLAEASLVFISADQQSGATATVYARTHCNDPATELLCRGPGVDGLNSSLPLGPVGPGTLWFAVDALGGSGTFNLHVVIKPVLPDGAPCDPNDPVQPATCDARTSWCSFDTLTCEPPVCGDSVPNYPAESCDDGNLQGGDGCSATCRLEGDRCRDAVDLTPFWDAVTERLELARTNRDFGDDIASSCGGGDGQVDAFYSFTAPAAGTYLIQYDHAYHGLLALFGPGCEQELACVDEDAWTGPESATIDLVEGQTVIIVADGSPVGGTGVGDEFTLKVQLIN